MVMAVVPLSIIAMMYCIVGSMDYDNSECLLVVRCLSFCGLRFEV